MLVVDLIVAHVERFQTLEIALFELFGVEAFEPVPGDEQGLKELHGGECLEKFGRHVVRGELVATEVEGLQEVKILQFEGQFPQNVVTYIELLELTKHEQFIDFLQEVEAQVQDSQFLEVGEVGRDFQDVIALHVEHLQVFKF